MSNKAIVVNDVSVRFNLAREKVDNVKEYALKKIRKQLHFDEFYALRNVSFSVERGDAFAIIGENGCGKSTLLKAISGIYYPDTGSVKTEGNISPLIELGAGFDMDLTARENIFLNGAVLGYSKDFMQEHFDEIIDFSELHEFIDVPLKNYSSGMIARLGFAIATVTTPDILIVDEILAVGDMNFQKKCEKKMQEMLSGGVTLLFVSHDINQVKSLCRHAIWLNKGIVQMVGDAETVADAYVKDMTENGGNGIVHYEDVKKEEEIREKSAEQKTEKKEKRGFVFITWLRIVAALMVLYHHVFEITFANLGIENALISFIHNHIIVPFGIDFGYLGVVIFFIVSGFLNTVSVEANSSGKYLYKKAKRIFPPLFVAIAGLWAMQFAFGKISGTPTYWAQFTFLEWIESATLIGHFTGVSEKVIGITWFLVPLVIYYLLNAALREPMKKYPRIYLVAATAFVAIFSFGLSYLGGLWFAFANYIQHIPLILFGQIIYMAYDNRIDKKSAAAIFALNFILIMQNVRLFLPINYTDLTVIKGPVIIIGIVIFALFFLMEKSLKTNSAVSFMGELSYFIYLTHYQIAQLIISPLASSGKLSSSLLAVIYLGIAIAVAVTEYLIIDTLKKLIMTMKRKLTR